jgi:hypothetical protein
MEKLQTFGESEATTEQFKMTRAEAKAWIKAAKRGTEFRAHVSMDQAIAGDTEMHYPNGARLAITLSRAEAVLLVSRYLTDNGEAAGRRIPCSAYTSKREGRPLYVAYWIGG